MKNKFLLTLFALIILSSYSSVQEEEQEELKCFFINNQDRINANNYIGAVESLSRIEDFIHWSIC